MPDEKHTIKSTDLVILKVRHNHESSESVYQAVEISKQTGALVLLLGPDETVDVISEDAVRELWVKLNERFGNEQATESQAKETPDKGSPEA